jgi:hypothetical protein
MEDRIFQVFVPDLPNLIRLMAEIAPLWTSLLVQYQGDTAESFFEKTFRAWHGHSLGGKCRRCDPDAVERWEARQKERAAAKASKAAEPHA